jgi:TonB family protein
LDSSLKLHFSFPCSLLLHALVLGILGYSFSSDYTQTEMIMLGAAGGNSGGPARSTIQATYTGVKPKVVKEKKVSKTSSTKPIAKEEVKPVAEQESTLVEGSGVGNGVGSGVGDGSGVHSFDNAVVNFREPVYPRQAIRRGIEGILKVRIKVNPEGVPQQVELVKSSGHSILDQSALDAIPTWRFKKAMALNLSHYWVEKTIAFQIKDTL